MSVRTPLLVLVLAAGLWASITLVPRKQVAKNESPAPPETVRAADVIAYDEMLVPTFRVRTTRDVLPGGYAASMAPVMVEWRHSDVRPDSVLLLRNVNDGGNPVSGVTVLRSARIRPDQVVRVEYIMVPLRGPGLLISHGQLRFVFATGGAEFVESMNAAGEPDALGDLVLSWEAWRPPGVDFSARLGMDPGHYQLSMRAYSGPQRFLEDALNARDWYTYELRLPGGREGAAELLRVALTLGDGCARYTIGRMLGRAEHEWASAGPPVLPEGGDAAAEWARIRASIMEGQVAPIDPELDMRDKTGYQSAVRSCQTMALYSIDVAVARLIRAGHPAAGMRPVHAPDTGDPPKWMSDLASASIAELFVHAPEAIRWVTSNRAAIPGEVPSQLDAAGLLVRDEHGPVREHFSIAERTPWGLRGQLLIR